MNDCRNAEIRDRLPDLLHDRLSASEREVVTAHVAACADCRDELELLRGVRSVLVATTPRVDVNYVLGALPKPPSRRTLAPRRARHVWSDWRIAAAATLLVAGGSSVALYTRGASHKGTPSPMDTAVAVAPAVQSPADSATVAAAFSQSPTEVLAAADDPTADVTNTEAGLSELNERQLKVLLNEIDQLKPIPVTDQDAAAAASTRDKTAPNGAGHGQGEDDGT